MLAHPTRAGARATGRCPRPAAPISTGAEGGVLITWRVSRGRSSVGRALDWQSRGSRVRVPSPPRKGPGQMACDLGAYTPPIPSVAATVATGMNGENVAGRRANNEGSLYRRASDGLWIGAVVIGFDEDGRPQRKTVSARARVDANKKLRALQRAVDDGLPPNDDRLTVGQLLDRWLLDVMPLRVSPATLGNYRSVVNNHIRPNLGRKRVSRLTPDDVQHFIRAKLDEGLSTRTVRLLRGVLVQALQHALRQGVVGRNVAALTEGPRLQQQEGRSLTIDEAKMLLKAADGDRLEALYLLMLSTGIRTGEALGLPWSNVNLDEGIVVIRQALTKQPGGLVIGEGKTGKKGWRTINVPEPVVDSLRRHHVRQKEERAAAGAAWNDRGLVFCTPIGTPVDPDNQRRSFAELTERAGLGHWHPHELRHSAASLMLAQGVRLEVVSEVLGHESIRITKDVYGHLGAKQLRGASDAMTEALWE